jgi:S1-C subfamily serine protease
MRVNRWRVRAGVAHAGEAAAWVAIVAAVGMVLGAGAGRQAIAAQGAGSKARTGTSATVLPATAPQTGRPAATTVRPAARVDPSKIVLPSDDWTFRPTVVVRRGTSQGSGTIIASIEGETLVLTAAHVVQERGPITVEVHRYNLGLERSRPAPGTWPRSLSAFVAATDPAADLAILRIEKIAALPYVARLAPSHPEPALDSIVTSIGIDLGIKLSSWSSRLVESLWFELNESRDERLFFITARAPEHGRSGGGLFLDSGELVGVCVGHAELVRGHHMGVFASRESIRQLLLDHRLDTIVALSELRQSRLSPRSRGRGPSVNAGAPTASPVTRTHAVGGNRR